MRIPAVNIREARGNLNVDLFRVVGPLRCEFRANN